MLTERWSAEAWPQVKAEFKAFALKSQIRRAGWFNSRPRPDGQRRGASLRLRVRAGSCRWSVKSEIGS
jgi:hypothetical protein